MKGFIIVKQEIEVLEEFQDEKSNKELTFCIQISNIDFFANNLIVVNGKEIQVKHDIKELYEMIKLQRHLNI